MITLVWGGWGSLEGKAPQRWLQRRLGRRLEGVAEAVRGGSFRLQMPSRLALAVRGTVAGHRLGALEGGEGGNPPPLLRCTAIPILPPVPQGPGEALVKGRYAGSCLPSVFKGDFHSGL